MKTYELEQINIQIQELNKRKKELEKHGKEAQQESFLGLKWLHNAELTLDLDSDYKYVLILHKLKEGINMPYYKRGFSVEIRKDIMMNECQRYIPRFCSDNSKAIVDFIKELKLKVHFDFDDFEVLNACKESNENL